MMLALLALLLLTADTTDVPATHVPAADDLSALSDPGRQVVTRAEIEAAGLYRLPDLFRLIDGMRTATVDGFTWRTSSAGRPFGAEAWTLLVDGVRLDFALFGEQNLSLVPVAVTQVDSVEIWHGPRLVAGTLAPGGVIHLHTSQARRGAEARGGFGLGNEVGDPGPFRYVPERFSPNVDKFGGDYEGLVSAAGAGGRAQARFKLLRFYATDPVAGNRNPGAIGGNPALRLFAPALRLETDALGGTHALSALGGSTNDLWFFQPFGREIPVRRLWGQLGAHGEVALTPRARLGYRLAYAENRLDMWDGTALGVDPRWRERTARAGLSGLWHKDALTVGLGGEVQRTAADDADGFTLGTVTGQLTRTAGRSHQRLDAALAVADDVAASVALHTRHELDRWTVGATAALTQQLPEQQGRFGFWRAQGYDAFAAELDVTQPDAPGTTTDLSLGADALGRLSPVLTLEAGAAVRSLRGLYIETQPFAPDPDARRPDRPLVIALDAEGEAVSGHAALRARRGPWRGRVFYDGTAPLGGDADFERAWEAVPRHRAGATATITADPSFTLTGTLTYRSAARWPAYDVLDGGNGGLYDATVPAAWLLDASAQKTLWRERLRISLLFRNLLGQEERYHPVGAALDLRFYLHAELIL